ncbi:hypothetical protein [Algoriphagus sp. AK58]|uniref:hypothetical protein n=1 Tax=Algoriphagus sp. AK58 TaxID=1406877 RepID=UPI00164EDCB6|nr:hypothetical protein [Algoriphagus sp. AK58]MBC6367804.1 hypothetical protein [Algoriphagus sp. AK58]
MKPVSLLIIFLLFACQSVAQSSYSGNVIDAWDKKYLEGVEVSLSGKGKTVTNSRGYFSIQAMIGDTLTLTFPGFIERKQILGKERYFLLELQDRARLLPTFQVKSEPYRFRFRDGKLTLIENETEEEKPFAQQVSSGTDQFSPNPNFSIYGPISYFTKRNRQLRQYDEKLNRIKRRSGYLEAIDSDSVRTEWMNRYQLDRSQWDRLIIRFNEFHQSHEFLDWPKEKVLNAMNDFFRIESYLND